MKGTRALAMVVLSFALAVGCGDDETGPGGGATVEDLVGSWDATAFTFTNRLNTTQRIDIVAEGGGANLTVDSSATYSLVVLEPGGAADVTSGVAVIESGFLLVTDNQQPGETVAFTFELSDGRLSLASDEVEFDFDNDGTEVPATLTADMRLVTGTNVADFVGTWDATVFRYISEPAGADTAGIIGLGGSFFITIRADASYSAGFSEMDELPVLEAGTVVVSGNRLFLVRDEGGGDPDEFRFEFSGSDMLELQADEEFDFDDNGTAEPATLEAVLVRR
jgi:hypothetical protein